MSLSRRQNRVLSRNNVMLKELSVKPKMDEKVAYEHYFRETQLINADLHIYWTKQMADISVLQFWTAICAVYINTQKLKVRHPSTAVLWMFDNLHKTTNE